MKTMTTTNNNNTIFGIILLKKKHSNYKLEKLRAKERSQFILENNQTIPTILTSYRAVAEHNYIVDLSIASFFFSCVAKATVLCSKNVVNSCRQI